MNNVEADLKIELNVKCPSCEYYFDLFEFENGRLNEDGYLINQACPEGHWQYPHSKFCEIVTCPFCLNEIKVEGIAW